MPNEDGATFFLKTFSDPEAVAAYAEGPRRFVPGLADLHRMTGILIAERAPRNARVLVVGAGGGMELKAMAEAHPDWTFVGVDPSREMLGLAERTLGTLAPRVSLIQGYVQDVPPGPFDAATCLLTFHFLREEERLGTAREIRSRLRPGAPFVVAHGCLPEEGGGRGVWASRYAAFAIASGADPDQVERARAAVEASANMVRPEQDEAILREAGFADTSLFFAAFTWRGWIGHA